MLKSAMSRLKALWDWFWFNELAREFEAEAKEDELDVELPDNYRPGRTIL